MPDSVSPSIIMFPLHVGYFPSRSQYCPARVSIGPNNLETQNSLSSWSLEEYQTCGNVRVAVCSLKGLDSLLSGSAHRDKTFNSLW